MSNLEHHHWMLSMGECHEKHIGKPPALYQRIAYHEAHASAERPVRISSLQRLWQRAIGSLVKRR